MTVGKSHISYFIASEIWSKKYVFCPPFGICVMYTINLRDQPFGFLVYFDCCFSKKDQFWHNNTGRSIGPTRQERNCLLLHERSSSKEMSLNSSLTWNQWALPLLFWASHLLNGPPTSSGTAAPEYAGCACLSLQGWTFMFWDMATN